MSAVCKLVKLESESRPTATCNICSTTVSQGHIKRAAFNTQNIKNKKLKILQWVHSSYVDKCTKAANTAHNLKRKEKYPRDSDMAKNISEKATEFTTLDNQLISVVEDQGFLQLQRAVCTLVLWVSYSRACKTGNRGDAERVWNRQATRPRHFTWQRKEYEKSSGWHGGAKRGLRLTHFRCLYESYQRIYFVSKKKKKKANTGIFWCKFNPWSNTPWHRVRPPPQEIKFSDY